MSLTGKYDDSNIFAKILRAEMPCVKVYEDAHILSFMDVFPQSKGHTLVIPKAASRHFLDASEKTAARVIAATQKIARAVNLALSPDGIVITQFNGAPAGQTVFHLHFHIIPRYEGAALGLHGGAGPMADMDELKMLAAKISAAL